METGGRGEASPRPSSDAVNKQLRWLETQLNEWQREEDGADIICTTENALNLEGHTIRQQALRRPYLPGASKAPPSTGVAGKPARAGAPASSVCSPGALKPGWVSARSSEGESDGLKKGSSGAIATYKAIRRKGGKLASQSLVDHTAVLLAVGLACSLVISLSVSASLSVSTYYLPTYIHACIHTLIHAHRRHAN